MIFRKGTGVNTEICSVICAKKAKKSLKNKSCLDENLFCP